MNVVKSFCQTMGGLDVLHLRSKCTLAPVQLSCSLVSVVNVLSQCFIKLSPKHVYANYNHNID